ncbi:nucleotide exchange factor GrpE [Lactonifactor sp. BIOML-A3]|uniref:nucleotide exchange factor GrpE n=1 Tax=Lactonifactor TaxID=420345 RepID=UPI0012AFEF3E|nr:MULTISPECIES: nucleotide exchange factor GrpE [Lactonifactor]MCB5712279.1 nucleotide exchange factor GrpE [Lactonifactor longoviformis]MCB5716323.1 nucleotide exchange factor GrpE [Lactonifactor longoviformis]MSA00522.1 nucleotide exchange factor GrpE [Lactonifactor sp. BIOML-A5]MSA06490.1 nucleotide exchange factor GrpE [Lactonifactor sp. BIOML-A4]MSA11164.1 nucleotide exchange factor GrpE [Lactonifactor sp. BIOML-A3]
MVAEEKQTVEEEITEKEAMEQTAEAQEDDIQESPGDTAEGTEEDTGECGQEESEEAREACEEKEKKGLFGKKKKDKKDQKIEELTDQLKRQMAEFDNFRKRTDKEKSAMYEIGAKEIIEKMLPIVDNFERGLGGVPEDKKEDPFVEGMNKIYKQMMTAFEELGVKPIEAVGSEFDPNLHNAVMHVDDEEAGENVVVEEFQKGYLYKENVVRHSMVKVAN